MAATHSATLNVVVNPNGVDTTLEFQYGLDTNYGNSIPFSGALSGNTEQPASVDLSGLEASTPYHWRVVATNSIGVTNGDDVVFTTLADQAGVPIIISETTTNIT
jgi:hypothetical protein